MVPTKGRRRGPKGIDVKVHNRIATIALTGGTAAQAIEDLVRDGITVSRTKVFEIFRAPMLKPDSDAAIP